MAVNLDAAVNSALAAVGQGSAFAGWCEKFVRTRYGFSAKYASAKLAWEASKRDGKVIKDTNAPAGVPVFWDITSGKNAPYDHVAISVGGGYCVSTSAGPGGTVAKVRIADLTVRWGMVYRGWGTHYHGVKVWGGATQAPKPPATGKGELRRGDSGPDVEALQRALNGWKTALPKLLPDGKYQAKTEARVREWQRRNRGGAYPSSAKVDGIAGPLTLGPLGVTVTGKPSNSGGGGGSAAKPSAPSKTVRDRLRRMGYAQTVEGVKRYQRNQGLVADGDWGSVTETWYQWVTALQGKLNEWKAVQRLGRLVVDGLRAAKTVRGEDAVIALPLNRKVLGIRNKGTKAQKRADLYKGLGIGPVPPKKG